MNLLSELLKKKNIEDISELSRQERATYESIEKELMAEVTVDSIKRFCEFEIKALEKEWLGMDYKGLTDLTVSKKELIIKARIKNYTEILLLFSKADKVKKHGIKRVKEILNN